MTFTVAIIQARMGSTRLPGKVLRPLLHGRPMLAWIVERVRRARLVDTVLVATTENAIDEPIAELCTAEGWDYFRGSEEDVLDRFYRAAQLANAENIVRVTADDPFVDPRVVDWVIAGYLSAAPLVDYAANNKPRTFPLGMDIEVFSASALARAWENDHSSWREHVTPYFYSNPQIFRLLNISNPVDYSHYRWTVDTPEDFELARRVYEHFGHGEFCWQDVLELLAQHSDWTTLNKHIEQKIASKAEKI